MQVVALLRGPALERWRIPRHGREVAVVQPVDRLLRLLHPGPALDGFAGAAVGAEADLGVLFGGPVVVVLCEAGADEEDVPDFDITALGGRADIDALEFADFDEVVVGDGVGGGGLVFDSHGDGV